MNLLLLAGNSLKNKEWIEEVANALSPHFNMTHTHYYKHWSTGDELIDLEYELTELTNTIGNLDEWVVFAKSAGTLLILRGVYEGKINPAKCIFAGTAILWGKEKGMEVEKWLTAYSVPTLFIQKSYDPAVPFGKLQQLLLEAGIQNAHFMEIPGDDHHYEDIELLKKETINFLNQ